MLFSGGRPMKKANELDPILITGETHPWSFSANERDKTRAEFANCSHSLRSLRTGQFPGFLLGTIFLQYIWIHNIEKGAPVPRAQLDKLDIDNFGLLLIDSTVQSLHVRVRTGLDEYELAVKLVQLVHHQDSDKSNCPKQSMFAVVVVAVGTMRAHCVTTGLPYRCELRVRTRTAALCEGTCRQPLKLVDCLKGINGINSIKQ